MWLLLEEDAESITEGDPDTGAVRVTKKPAVDAPTGRTDVPEMGLWQPGDPMPGSTPEELAAGANPEAATVRAMGLTERPGLGSTAPAGPGAAGAFTPRPLTATMPSGREILGAAGDKARGALDATGLKNRDVLPAPGLGPIPPGLAAKGVRFVTTKVPELATKAADAVGGYMNAPLGETSAPATSTSSPSGASADLPAGTSIVKKEVGFQGEQQGPPVPTPVDQMNAGLDLEAEGSEAAIRAQQAQKEKLGALQTDVRSGLVDIENERSRIVTEKGAKLNALREKIATSTVDPNRLFAEMSTGESILGGIAVALGGFVQGFQGGGPNAGYEMIMDAVNRDVMKQQADRDNLGTLYALAKQDFDDDLDALAVSKVTMLEVAQAATDEIIASGAAPEAEAAITQLRGKLEQAKASLLLGLIQAAEKAKGDAAAKILPAEQAAKLGGYLSAIEGAEDVYAQYKDVGITGFLQGVPVLSWIPTAGKRFELYKQAQVRDLVHALSGADAPEKQFEAFVQMFPAANDLGPTAASKMEALRKFLRGRYHHTLQALTDAGYDTARLPSLRKAAQGYVPGEFEDFIADNPEIADEMIEAAHALGGSNAVMKGIYDEAMATP